MIMMAGRFPMLAVKLLLLVASPYSQQQVTRQKKPE
jgi:hypothetical protein